MEVGFDLFHQVLFRGFDEGQGRALVVAAGRAAHAVDVRLDVAGEVKVDDVGHELEVDATHHARLAILIPPTLKHERNKTC